MATIILGDIVEVIKETVHNPQESGFQYFVGLEHYDSGEPLITRYATPDNLTSSVKHFAKGDILVARRNVYLKRASLVDFEGVTSGDSIVLRAKDKKYQQILPFILNSDDFWDYAEQNSDGTMSKRLSPADLLDYEFEEPENIELLADKLWAAYRVKESYKKLLAATDDMLKAKFQEMFGDCDSSIECLSFEEVFTIKDNLRCPLNDTTRKDMHGGDALYPYYGANGLVDHINQYKIDMTAICLAEDCGKYGPGEETAYIIHGKSWVNNHAHILVPKDNCDIVYAKMLFTIMDLNKYVDNDNRKKLTQANMKKIKILCPPLPLQQQFVEIATQAEATKESLRKSIENIDQVIKSLINQ